jgi:hypothetical protein
MPMSVKNESFVSLVDQAYAGALKLPAFQRDWKWRVHAVRVLFDSVRRGYPIGGFLLADPAMEIDLAPRAFRFARKEADKAITKSLVLDGQQRLTAGVQLFTDGQTDDRGGNHFFLSIEKLEAAIAEYAEQRRRSVESVVEDESAVAEFVEGLDADQGYLVYRQRSQDPYKFLLSNHWIYTPLLVYKNQKRFGNEIEKYLEQNPGRKKLISNVVREHFAITDGPDVPMIVLEQNSAEALSRIFATLNHTGRLLTPFELVVATLYPKKIDLREEIRNASETHVHYPNMDKSGEIALQTAVLLDNKEPKKSLLPKTLTASIWNKYRSTSFETLEAVGAMLTQKLGFALDKTGDYIPYDSLFAPVAYAWERAGIAGLKTEKRKKALDKFAKFAVGACLSTRYKEGVHNKQAADASQLHEWIKTDSDANQPAWLAALAVPSLKNLSPSGAIGKLILCLMNREPLIDPITRTKVPLGDSAQNHHVFPTKFVPNLKGWDKQDNANQILNIMRLEAQTNIDLAKSDPRELITRAKAVGAKDLANIFERHFLDEKCVKLLAQASKTRATFVSFIDARDRYVRELIATEFGFAIGPDVSAIDEDEEDAGGSGA